MRVAVVEDQPVARRHLRDILEAVEDVEWVGEAGDGPAALALIAEASPDLVFLDIEIPGVSGLEVLRRADPRPLAVFTTAFDRHAVTAFELHALDYVLKPFGAARIRAALERAGQALAEREAYDQWTRTEGALGADESLARVFVRYRGRIVPVTMDAVDHVEANGDYVTLWEGTRSHLVRVAFRDLLSRLDPTAFVRVHRSHAVNLAHVAELVPRPDGRLVLVLSSGRRVTASRRETPGLRARLRLG